MKFNTRVVTGFLVILVLALIAVTDAGMMGKGMKNMFKKGGYMMLGNRMMPMPVPIPIPIPIVQDKHTHEPCPTNPQPVIVQSSGHGMGGMDEW